MIKFSLCIFTVCVLLFGCSGKQPANLGVHQGKLSPCPNSPNCVSSQSSDESHHIEPLQYVGTLEEARDKMLSLIRSMKRVRVVTVSGDYIHAEFSSALFRFVDDVEFLFDEKTKTIHLRSASRIGYSDLGMNRKRMERIRSGFSGEVNQ